MLRILCTRKIRMDEEERRYEERGEGRERRNGHMKAAYFNPKPVKAGDEVEVSIEGSASGGDGVARVNGFVIFVKGAKPGDSLKIRVTEVRARFAIGEPVS